MCKSQIFVFYFILFSYKRLVNNDSVSLKILFCVCPLHRLTFLVCIIGCLLLWCSVGDFVCCRDVSLGTLFVLGFLIVDWTFLLDRNTQARSSTSSLLNFCYLVEVIVSPSPMVVNKCVIASFLTDLG